MDWGEQKRGYKTMGRRGRREYNSRQQQMMQEIGNMYCFSAEYDYEGEGSAVLNF